MYNEEKEVTMSFFDGLMGDAAGSAAGQKGTGQNKLQGSKFSPEQMQLFQSLFSHVGADSQTSRLARGDKATFDQIEAPALQQFGALQGQLASRFSGAGMGARRSSGFQNASTQATQDFASQLQSRRHDLQRNALKDLMDHSNMLLGQQSAYGDENPQEEEPWWYSLIAGGLPIAGAVGGGFLGSAIPGVGTLGGATLGGSLGSTASKAWLGR
jgi:hypothetical protein